MTAETTDTDYSKTLYLPETDFPMRAGLPESEPRTLARWAEIDLYKRLRAFDLGRFEHLQFSQCRNCSPCDDLATLLEELDAASGELSDWLAMRYFTHVSDVSRQTMAL